MISPQNNSNSPDLTIGSASSLAELAAIRQLFLEYSQELGVDLGFQGFTEELASLPGIYGPPQGSLLLARARNFLAGCVALRPRGPDVCEMKRMFVRPAYRRGGLGRRLALAIMAEARRLGYRRMVLDTLAHMKPARQLYESLGFRPCAPYYHNPLPEVVYMELWLH